MARRQTTTSDTEVRMGPLALFTLMAVICLAVLAVLALSTANATMALAQRRADATDQLYLNEAAAQAFVASLDEQLAAGADDQVALQQASDAATALPAAHNLPDGQELQVSASVSGDTYSASFDCGNGRQLEIALTRDGDGGLRVQKWRMTTVVNDEPMMGDLLGSF